MRTIVNYNGQTFTADGRRFCAICQTPSEPHPQDANLCRLGHYTCLILTDSQGRDYYPVRDRLRSSGCDHVPYAYFVARHDLYQSALELESAVWRLIQIYNNLPNAFLLRKVYEDGRELAMYPCRRAGSQMVSVDEFEFDLRRALFAAVYTESALVLHEQLLTNKNLAYRLLITLNNIGARELLESDFCHWRKGTSVMEIEAYLKNPNGDTARRITIVYPRVSDTGKEDECK